MGKLKAPVAVVVLITRDDGVRQVLLQRRQNTGFGDGMWDFACSGHAEEGESLTEACVRECARDFEFFTLIYKRDGNLTYVNPYFHLTKYDGEPAICEPSKCSELRWFDVSALPEDLLPDRRATLKAQREGVKLIEYGWK